MKRHKGVEHAQGFGHRNIQVRKGGYPRRKRGFSSHSIAHGASSEMSAKGVPPLNQCDLKGHAAGKGIGVGGGVGGSAASAALPGLQSKFWTYHPATAASTAIGKRLR
jgi:hypothetical protein